MHEEWKKQVLASPLVVKLDEPEYSSHRINPYVGKGEEETRGGMCEA